MKQIIDLAAPDWGTPVAQSGESTKTTEEVNLMIKFWLIAAAALVLGWVTVALAQVSVDRYTRGEGTEVQEQAASNTEKHLPYPGLVYSYTGKQETDNPNRFLDRYNQPHNGGSGVNSTGPVYNPYTIRW